MAAPGIKFCVGHSEMSSSRASASSQDHCNKTFTDFSHHVLYQVNVQRFYGAFCDVAVKVENFSFKAHKCILAAGSPKLQTMLYDYHPDRSHVLHLRDVTVNGFKCILDFLYTGHLKFDASSFSEVMSASRILQMPDIEQACIEFQFYRDMMSVPGSGTALPGSSSTSSTQAQPGIPPQLPQQTTQLGVSGQHHLSSLTQQERVSSSQLQQQTQSSRLSSHPSFHTTTHPPKLDLIDQPRYTAQGLQQMQSSRYPSSSSSQQISHNHESQVHTGGQYGGTVSQSHVSEIQTEPITPSSLDLNNSQTYKSPPPGGGHPTQSTNRSTGHSSSVSQHLGFSKGSASHSHSSNTSSLPFLQGHMLGGQGHLLQDQGHIEPISQPGTPQPIMSVTPPPNQNHPAAHGSLALTPISTMDTNCIEDYLKMIESMQTEQQIQQQSTYGASTSTKTNQMQTTPVSDTLAGSSVPTAPPLPKPYQHKTPSTGTRNPKKDYIASADIAAASMASSALSSSSQVSVSSQVNQKSLSLSTSAGSGTRNQYSTEDVRKTLLSVLSQQFDVTGDAAPVGQDTHGSQYSTQNSLTAKDGNIYSQPHSTYSNKYYSGNVSGSHSSVSQRLNFDNMPSQNSHGYANPAVDATGYASSNQYVGQYGGIEYSSHYDTNVDSTSVYSANSPAQALAPAHDGPSGGSRMNYMNTAALVATSSGRSSLQYSTRDQEALSMMNSYSVMQDRLSRLTPVDDNIATSALSSDSEMDGLTMEAIESLAEKMTAKDTPEDNVTPVQGERSSSPANLMSRLSPISLASEPSYPQTTGEQEDILSGSQSHNEPPKLLSLAAQTSLQAMLPQENQSHTQPITSGGKPGILPAVSLQSAPQLPNTSETAINIIPQSYTQPISPPSPLSPDFGMEDRKLKMKKKRKVPLKIKLKRNYSSEHWDTFSFPSTNQCVPIPGQQPEGTNHNSVLPNRFTFPASIQRDTQNSSSRFKDSSSLLTANHIGAQQSSLHSSADSSSQHIMQSSASFVSSLPNQQHFDHNTQTVQGSQNDYVASPPPFSWEDLTPSNQSTVQSGKLSTVQERTQANVPQMPAKLRLSNNHQNMYYGSLTTCANHNNAQTTTTSQTSQELPSNNHGNSTLFTSPQGNSMTTTYGIQNYDPISENSNPERGLEELLEKSSDNYYEINSSTVSSARLEQDKTNVATTSSSANKVSGNIGYSNESAPPEKSEQPTKLAKSDTVSLTTINKDDLISEIDSLRRDHEESQAIERTKLKKKKKFFISADNDSSVGSPKDSPKYRILKKKYRHSFVRSVNEKVKKPSAEKLNKKKREKKDKKVHQHHGMSTLEKKRSKALEIRKEAENRPLKKRLQLKPVPIKKEPSNKVKMKICPKCSREFYRFARYKMHMQLHFNGEGHACSKCGMLFNRLSDVTMHMRQHNNVKFECTECLQIYSDAKDFKKHMIEVHQDTNCFKCTEPGCGYKAARMSLLEAHIETHKENKSYVCTSCGKSFKQANGLRNHMKSCVPSKTYLCEFCPSKFNRLESLKTHARTHTGDKPHKCPECGAGFTDPKNLNRHRRIHLNQYPYPCKHCDKKFRHSNTLKLHVLRQHKDKNNTATKDV